MGKKKRARVPVRGVPESQRPWETMTQRTGLEGGNALADRYGMRHPDEVWGNNLFTCVVRYALVDDISQDRDGLLWLSIHRRDRAAIHDWRHFQTIKNEVAGPDRIALEVYPAEQDLVDTSNEYHLWVLPTGAVVPFGFDKALVMTPEEVAQANERDADVGGGNAVQREWQPGLSTGKERK